MESELGPLLVRLALGPMLVMHGANKLWGRGGLAGTTRWFEAIGLRPAAWHARLATVTEIVAGTLVTVGLFTTPAAAAYVGLMLVAIWTDHRGKGYFVFRGGYEYALVIALVAVGLAALGAGGWSLDAVFGLDLAGAGWASAATLAGSLAALGILVSCYRRPPTMAASSDG